MPNIDKAARERDGAPEDPNFTADEIALAQVIYDRLKENRFAYVSGRPQSGEDTAIDGTFDLREIARFVRLYLSGGRAE